MATITKLSSASIEQTTPIILMATGTILTIISLLFGLVTALVAYHKKVSVVKQKLLTESNAGSNAQTSKSVETAENEAYGAEVAFSPPDVITRNRVYDVIKSQAESSSPKNGPPAAKNKAHGGFPDVISKNSAYGATAAADDVIAMFDTQADANEGAISDTDPVAHESESDPYQLETLV
jgi:hypothetical protein